jgi:ATP-dependent Lon protease
MVFIGNIDRIDTLVKTSHLFAPFPEVMIDSAFFDRFHAYTPGVLVGASSTRHRCHEPSR